jgi:hypothetical protein
MERRASFFFSIQPVTFIFLSSVSLSPFIGDIKLSFLHYPGHHGQYGAEQRQALNQLLDGHMFKKFGMITGKLVMRAL